jgi:hypothetical protein
MFWVMGCSAKINTVRGKLHRFQFHVGFLEKVVRAQGDLEVSGDFLGGRGRNDGGRQGEHIGIEGNLLAQDGIGHGNLDNGSTAFRGGRCYLGRVFRHVPDELDVFSEASR